MFRNRTIMAVFLLLSFLLGKAEGGRFHLFSDEVKTAYPSAVYDFLETYLYRLDSLHREGVQEHPSMMRDKVLFLKGESSVAYQINPKTDFTLTRMEDKMFNAVWKDSTGVVLLDMVYQILATKSPFLCSSMQSSSTCMNTNLYSSFSGLKLTAAL